MQTTKNRINIHAGYWSICKTCCDWSDNAVEDSWNPSPGVGWYCPACAGKQADKCETFPRLMPEPKREPVVRRMTWRDKLACWWFWFVDGDAT